MPLGTMGTLALLGTAASVGSTLWQSAADKKRKEELAELEAREASGEMGLTDEERALYAEQYLEPAKAQAQEQMERQMAQRSAAGDRYGGSMAAEEQAQREITAGTAQRAATQIKAQDIQAEKENKLYMDQLIADKAARQTQMVGSVGKAMTQMAGTMGRYQGSELGYLSPKYDQSFSELEDLYRMQGVPEEEISRRVATMRTDPDIIAYFERDGLI
ncbi:MAG: hypothetical protein ABIL09_13820 [Gemmatimonadota bacterium]